MSSILLIFALLGTALAMNYDNYCAYVVGPIETSNQVEIVELLRSEDTRTRKVQVLQDVLAIGKTADVLVAPDRVELVENALRRAGIPFQLMEDNVQRSLNKTMNKNAQIRERWYGYCRRGRGPPEMYMEYEEQIRYLKSLAARSKIAKYSSMGKSFEGREMPLVTINGHRKDLPGIWLDTGIHAREWLAHATIIYILETILTDNGRKARDLRKNYRIYIAPNINPDGYVYSWTEDRFWRKNRSNNGGCGGVDLNRNYDVNYDFCGTSSDPCSDLYSGPGPASEVETKVVVKNVKHIQKKKGGLELYISVHSYAQLWLLPWGGNITKPSDFDELRTAAEKAVDAVLGVNGLEFTAGGIADLFGCIAGATLDWAKNDGTLTGDGADIKYAFGIELRPRLGCCGLEGFNPDPSNIGPSGKEIFAGFYANIKAVE